MQPPCHSVDQQEVLRPPLVTTSGAGVARTPRHHLFPQQFREWFTQRGGDIDRFTVPQSQGPHSALHTVGWNQNLMETMRKFEVEVGRQLTSREVWTLGHSFMRQHGLDVRDLIHYGAP